MSSSIGLKRTAATAAGTASGGGGSSSQQQQQQDTQAKKSRTVVVAATAGGGGATNEGQVAAAAARHHQSNHHHQQQQQNTTTTTTTSTATIAASGSSSSSNHNNKQASASAAEKAQERGMRMVKVSENCGSRMINPHLADCHFNNFYRFASCMDRMMFTLTWGMVLEVKNPDDVPAITRAFLENQMRQHATNTEDLLRLLCIADQDVLHTQWTPLKADAFAREHSTPEILQKVELVQLDVLMPEQEEEEDFEEEEEEGAPPSSSSLSPRLPPVTRLRFVSKYAPSSHVLSFRGGGEGGAAAAAAGGEEEVGFKFAQESLVEDRDCYLNSFRYIVSVLLMHEFFRLQSEEDAHKALRKLVEDVETKLASPKTGLRDWVQKELGRLVQEGKEADDQLQALLNSSDGPNRAVAQAEKAVESTKAKIEACKRELQVRTGPMMRIIMESAAAAAAAAGCGSAGGGGGLGNDQTDDKEEEDEEEDTDEATLAFRSELKQSIEKLNHVFARRLDELGKKLDNQQKVLADERERASGIVQDTERLRIQKERGDAAFLIGNPDGIVEALRRQIRRAIVAYAARFKGFASLVGPKAKALAATLKEYMSLKEVALDSRMAIFRAMQRHFAATKRFLDEEEEEEEKEDQEEEEEGGGGQRLPHYHHQQHQHHHHNDATMGGGAGTAGGAEEGGENEMTGTGIFMPAPPPIVEQL